MARHADVDAEALRGYAEGVLLRRQGTPEDVAAAVVYLASDAANFVTGQRIAVNGGKTGLGLRILTTDHADDHR